MVLLQKVLFFRLVKCFKSFVIRKNGFLQLRFRHYAQWLLPGFRTSIRAVWKNVNIAKNLTPIGTRIRGPGFLRFTPGPRRLPSIIISAMQIVTV